jgi:hypothetical protein
MKPVVKTSQWFRGQTEALQAFLAGSFAPPRHDQDRKKKGGAGKEKNGKGKQTFKRRESSAQDQL